MGLYFSYAKVNKDTLSVRWKNEPVINLELKKIKLIRFHSKDSSLRFYGTRQRIYLKDWDKFPDDIINVCTDYKVLPLLFVDF